MFGEEIVPVCSPALLRDRARPLKSPADLRHHVLLHFDDVDRAIPSLSWNVWLEAEGLADLKPAASLRFSHYDQVVNAALGGQGVALGRRPLVRNLIADGSLVTPLRRASLVDRAYYIVRTPATQGRGGIDDFVQWLIAESADAAASATSAAPPSRAAGRKRKERR
jgi:DNA-binding transcriptional LysR family regulator